MSPGRRVRAALLDMLRAQDIHAAEELMRVQAGHTRGLWAGRRDAVDGLRPPRDEERVQRRADPG
jgi:hypothetical protein